MKRKQAINEIEKFIQNNLDDMRVNDIIELELYSLNNSELDDILYGIHDSPEDIEKITD